MHPRNALQYIAKFIVPDWGDKVDSGIGLLYLPARTGWQAGTTTLCWSQLYNPSQGLWIWLCTARISTYSFSIFLYILFFSYNWHLRFSSSYFLFPLFSHTLFASYIAITFYIFINFFVRTPLFLSFSLFWSPSIVLWSPLPNLFNNFS